MNEISILSLAHVGDAVYELLVRSYLARHGQSRVVDLHRATVAMVRASAQAKASAALLPMLTESERAVYRRGRNSHVNSVPRGASKALAGAGATCPYPLGVPLRGKLAAKPPEEGRSLFAALRGQQHAASPICQKMACPSTARGTPLPKRCRRPLLRTNTPSCRGRRRRRAER